MQRSCGVAIAWSCNYMHIRTFQFPYMYIYNYPLSVFTIRVSTHRTYIYMLTYVPIFHGCSYMISLFNFFFVKEEKNWHFSNMCWPSSFTKTNLILSSLIIFFKITLTLEGEFLINLNIYKKNMNIKVWFSCNQVVVLMQSGVVFSVFMC